jgi:hypothetical protein
VRDRALTIEPNFRAAPPRGFSFSVLLAHVPVKATWLSSRNHAPKQSDDDETRRKNQKRGNAGASNDKQKREKLQPKREINDDLRGKPSVAKSP